MAKMFYNFEETLGKLNCTEEKLRDLVRSGKLREFRDAGKLNYRIEEVDGLAAGGGPGDSGALALEDSGEIPLAPLEDETHGRFRRFHLVGTRTSRGAPG